MFSTVALFQVFVGAYLVYAAITGSGAAYKVEGLPEEAMPLYKKVMRIFCACAGPLCIMGGVFEYLATSGSEVFRILAMVISGIIFAGIVVFIVWLVRLRRGYERAAQEAKGKSKPSRKAKK